MTYQEILEKVKRMCSFIQLNFLPHELGRFLWITAEEQMALLISCGLNLNDPALIEEGQRMSGGMPPGGQCLAGACGEIVLRDFRKNCPPVFKSHLGEEGITRYLSKVAGYIQIFVSNIAQDIAYCQEKTGQELSDEQIAQEVLLNVAHEYRHAWQSEELVNLSVLGWADKKAYDSQPHEEDANIFAVGVINGWCELKDAPTWQPTPEQREEALRFWAQVQDVAAEIYAA